MLDDRLPAVSPYPQSDKFSSPRESTNYVGSLRVAGIIDSREPGIFWMVGCTKPSLRESGGVRRTEVVNGQTTKEVPWKS